jgi:Citrate transporter
MRLLASHQDLLLLTNPQEEEARQGMGRLAVLIFAASLALTATCIPISLALLTGAAAMIISGIVTADEAYKAIEWKTIVLIGSMIPFGIAMQRTGMSELISGSIAGALYGPIPWQLCWLSPYWQPLSLRSSPMWRQQSFSSRWCWLQIWVWIPAPLPSSSLSVPKTPLFCPHIRSMPC